MRKLISHSALASLLLAGLMPAASQAFAQQNAPAPSLSPAPAAAGGLTNLGAINMDAASSRLGQGYVVYTQAKMRTESGAALDADEIRANLAQNTNTVQNVVAAGHVHAFMDQPETHRSYTVTADKAVYNPATQRIDLSGNVKTTVVSSYTVEPLIQTGDSAYIQLGPAPDYPQITMSHVHTTFTPRQSAPAPNRAATRSKPKRP